MKRTISLILCAALVATATLALAACGKADTPPIAAETPTAEATPAAPTPPSTPQDAPPESNQSNDVLASALKAYYELLSSAVAEHGFGRTEQFDDWGGEYFQGVIYAELIDFDNDGIPELLYIYGDDVAPYAAICVVYGYMGGSLKLFGSYGIYLNHYWISIGTSANGPSYLRHYQDPLETYYTIIDSQWVEVLNTEYREEFFYEVSGYFVNGEHVTEQGYNEAITAVIGSHGSHERLINIFDLDYGTVNAVLSELESK